MIEVVEIQLLVVHCVAPIDIDGDVSIGAKFVPENVRIEPPVVGPFAKLTDVTTGAASRHEISPRDQILSLHANGSSQQKQLHAHRRT